MPAAVTTAEAGGTMPRSTPRCPARAATWKLRVAVERHDAAALAVAVDSHDNVYVAGLAESDLTFAGHTITSSAPATRSSSATATGAYRWAKRFGSRTSLVGAYGIAVDRDDNIFITGGLFGSADFGAGALGGAGAFVASFDAAGTYRWARADGGGTGSLAIAVAGTHVYSIGRFSGTMTFSPAIR